MTNTHTRPRLLSRNTYRNSTYDDDSADVACNGRLPFNSAFYRVEVLFREDRPTCKCWETFIFTDFEQAAHFIQNAEVAKSKIFFQPRQCSDAGRGMYPISKVLSYVDVSGSTFHLFISGKNCADEDICCKFGELHARPKRFT